MFNGVVFETVRIQVGGRHFSPCSSMADRPVLGQMRLPTTVIAIEAAAIHTSHAAPLWCIERKSTSARSKHGKAYEPTFIRMYSRARRYTKRGLTAQLETT